MFFWFFEGEKVTALTLANYILERAQLQNHSVTNLKLQKILYYVQGYFLARFERPLFPDEIQAWRFGPVVPNVYYEFSRFGSDELVMLSKPDMSNCSQDEIRLIDRVIDSKLKYDARALYKKTHLEAPWRDATDNGTTIKMNTVISNQSMKDFFKSEML